MTIVIDVGSRFAKFVFGGEPAPRGETMSCVGLPKYCGIMVGMDQKDAYSGGAPPVSNVLGSGDAAPPEAPSGGDTSAQPSDQRRGGEAQEPPHQRQRNFAEVPGALEACFGRLLPDVRPCIIRAGSTWSRERQETLIGQSSTQVLGEEEQAHERNRAFDLLDALTLSGKMVINTGAELHVLLASQCSFGKSVMETLVVDNSNPMDRMERSGIIMASVVHQERPECMLTPHDVPKQHLLMDIE